MTAKTIDDSNITRWLRPQIGDSDNILLVGDQKKDTSKNVCQQLLTTVSYRQEAILAIGYGDKESTWLNNLKRPNINTTVKWIDNIENREEAFKELESTIDEFTKKYSEYECIIYIDSLSPLFRDFDFVTSYNFCQDLTQLIEKRNATGFLRIDLTLHNQREIETLSRIFDFTASLIDESDKWILEESQSK